MHKHFLLTALAAASMGAGNPEPCGKMRMELPRRPSDWVLLAGTLDGIAVRQGSVTFSMRGIGCAVKTGPAEWLLMDGPLTMNPFTGRLTHDTGLGTSRGTFRWVRNGHLRFCIETGRAESGSPRLLELTLAREESR